MSRRLFSGSDNEVWSYGEEALAIFTKYMMLREKMRPYLTELMKEVHEKGTPVIRTLFYEYPDDRTAWQISDEFMLGSKILIAPVLYEDMRKRQVYLPEGNWRNINDGKVYAGGAEYTFDAPLEEIPVFLKDGCLSELM